MLGSFSLKLRQKRNLFNEILWGSCSVILFSEEAPLQWFCLMCRSSMVLLNVPFFNEILLDSCSVKISQNPLHFGCTFESAIKVQSMKAPTKTIALGLHFQKCNESAMKMQQMLNQFEGNFSKTSSKLRSNLDESALKMKILHCNHGTFFEKIIKIFKKT